MSRTRRLVGLLAAGLLATSVIPLAATADDDPVHEPFEVTDDAGRIELVTGRDSEGNPLLTITQYTTADGNVVVDSEFESVTKQSKCKITPSTFSSILSISVDAEPKNIGLVSNGLGSSDLKNCNTSNGRVENGQTLTLTLPAGLRADRAKLDIEGKFGARLLATGTLDGKDTLDTSPTNGLSLSGENQSDNGSDAGESDNREVQIGTTAPGDDFDTLKLKALGGEFALEGGGDWTSKPVVSTIYLVTVVDSFDYTLGCGDDIDIDFTAGTTEPQKAQSAFLTRYDAEGKDESACLPIGASITSDGESVTLDNTDFDALGGGQNPYLRLTLTWRVALLDSEGNERPMEEVYAELERQVDFDLEEALPADEDLPLVQYCLTDNDDADGMKPATQPDGINWCLLSDTTVVENDFLIQTQIYDGEGDPRWL